ncbi:MAG: hydroxyacid dehydrogenase, partial [Flavobacteriales bacterium]|nr:hydroxyacid dehydrogenase [Flavobacteriales bacterium]
ENENFKFNLIHPDSNFTYLVNCNNVIITPHIAGLSKESNKKLSEVLINKILKLT